MIDLSELYELTTPELVQIAFTVSALLRERAGQPPFVDEEARSFHNELLAAGEKGVQVGGFRLVLRQMQS